MDLSGNRLSGSIPTEWGENWTDVRFRSLISGATIIFISPLRLVSPALSMPLPLALCFYTIQVLPSIFGVYKVHEGVKRGGGGKMFSLCKTRLISTCCAVGPTLPACIICCTAHAKGVVDVASVNRCKSGA